MLIKKIFKKLGFFKKSNSFREVDKEINRVAVLIYNEIGYFNNCLSLIKDDFTFTEFNLKKKQIIQKELESFDFLLLIDDWNGVLDSFIRKNYNLNIPVGIIITNTIIPKKNNLFFYDVAWFQNFEFKKQRYNHPRLFHALVNEIENKDLLSWDKKYCSCQIRIGINSVIRDKTRVSNRLVSGERFKVGVNSFYNSNFTVIGSEVFVVIGSFCSFGNNLKIYTTNHDINYPTTQGYLYRKYFKSNHPGEYRVNPSLSRTKGPIIVKNDVWIGDDVKIMSGVTIGNGACIAAGSVVTSDVNDFDVVGGVPAKFLKKRFSNDVIEFLLDIKWWDWSEKMIKINQDFFNQDLNSVKSIDEIKINF